MLKIGTVLESPQTRERLVIRSTAGKIATAINHPVVVGRAMIRSVMRS